MELWLCGGVFESVVVQSSAAVGKMIGAGRDNYGVQIIEGPTPVLMERHEVVLHLTLCRQYRDQLMSPLRYYASWSFPANTMAIPALAPTRASPQSC